MVTVVVEVDVKVGVMVGVSVIVAVGVSVGVKVGVSVEKYTRVGGVDVLVISLVCVAVTVSVGGLFLKSPLIIKSNINPTRYRGMVPRMI